MADQQEYKKVRAAFAKGDIPAIKSFLAELNFGPDHPRDVSDQGAPLGDSEHAPSLNDLLTVATCNRQIEALSFLCSCVSNCRLLCYTVRAATDTQDVELVKTVCTLDPCAADSDVLGYACSNCKNPDIVKVLLDAGANPNRTEDHCLPYSDISYAVIHGLPVATVEQFFDAGYEFNDAWALRWAVKCKRPEVVKILFARGGHLPTARVPPLEELVKEAEENDDPDMVALLRKSYRSKPPRGKGVIAGLIARFRTHSHS